MENLLEHQGKVSVDKALELILKHRTRYGRRVMSESPKLAAEESKANKRILRAKLREIKKKVASGRDRRPAELQMLEAQREILTAMIKHGDRRVSQFEMAGAIALSKGLAQEDIGTHYRALRRTYGDEQQNVSFTTTDNRLQRIHDHLLAAREPVKGTDISRDLKISTNVLNAGTAILDFAGIINKQPTDHDGKVRTYRWQHAKFPSPAPRWNNAYQIFKILAEAKAPLTKQQIAEELEKQYGKKQEREKMSRMKFKVSSITSTIKPHVLSGAIVEKGNGHVINEDYRTMVLQTEEQNKAHPDLHNLLLGTYETDKPPFTPKRKKQILKAIRIEMALETNTGTLRELARKLKVPESAVRQKKYKKDDVLKGVKPQRLEAIAKYLKAEGYARESEHIRKTRLK